MGYKIFQYVPMSKSRALSRVIPKIIGAGAVPVLDTEDSVQDTLNPANTGTLKKDAQESIPSLIAAVSERVGPNWPIYLRVNSMETKFFQDDLAVLRQLSKDGF